MRIGLGLPANADGPALIDWARRAEESGFSTIGLLDRYVYDNPEPLVTLSMLAGATDRIRLQTEVLLAPLRETVLLAKQAATLDRLSGGRFTLGVGVGGRADDFHVAGIDMKGRGRRFDNQLATMRRLWNGESFDEESGCIGPEPTRAGGPELLFGAFAPSALERVARFGDGLLCALPLPYAESSLRSVDDSWAAAGREGSPRHVCQINVALGDEGVEQARRALTDYYAFGGDMTARVVDGLHDTPSKIRDAIAAYTDIGADELMLYVWAPGADQVDRIADAIG